MQQESSSTDSKRLPRDFHSTELNQNAAHYKGKWKVQPICQFSTNQTSLLYLCTEKLDIFLVFSFNFSPPLTAQRQLRTCRQLLFPLVSTSCQGKNLTPFTVSSFSKAMISNRSCATDEEGYRPPLFTNWTASSLRKSDLISDSVALSLFSSSSSPFFLFLIQFFFPIASRFVAVLLLPTFAWCVCVT